jgi:hypothetical protein
VGAACVVAVAIVIAALAFTSSSNHNTTTSVLPPTNTTTTITSSTLPPSSPEQQAAALTTLLRSAPTDRAILQSSIDAIQMAVDGGGGCSTGASAAQSNIERVASNRETLLGDLDASSFSAIPAGQDVKADLRRAWLISERIDRAFEQWATTELSHNCQLGDSDIASYRTTEVLDPKSTQIKTIFVNRWNPIARQFNQPSNWSASQI